MATAYYTDLYKSSSQPDSNVPAGVVLCQHTTFTGVTGNHGSGDTFYMAKLPKGAVLLDIQVAGPAISGGTLAIGTTATIETNGSDISAGAGTIVNGATVTGIWKFNLDGGYQGTTDIVQTTLNGTVRRGSKAADNEVGIYMTFSTAYPAADDVLYFTMMYYMDAGADMAYDPG
jgi:hypothetical protein